MVYKYGYEEYYTAICEDPSQENLAVLGEWFLEFGEDSWNGECYKVDNRRTLKPIHAKEPDEYGSYPIVSWELNWF